MKDFYQELVIASALIKKHHQALIVTVAATLMMVIVQSPSIGLFEQLHYASLIVYGGISVAVLWLICRIPLAQLNLGIGDIRFWLPASAAYLLVALPLVVYGAKNSAMVGYYQNNALDWGSYIWTTSVYLLGWEYFFRGYFIAGLRQTLKEGAILIQMIPFTLLHLGKPDSETITCIFSGLVWGYICYKGKSFWPAFFMHLIVNLVAVLSVNGV